MTQSNPKQRQYQGCHYSNTDKAKNQSSSRSHKLQHVCRQRHVTCRTRRVQTNTASRTAHQHTKFAEILFQGDFLAERSLSATTAEAKYWGLQNKGRLVGPFQHCIRKLIVLLPPDEFLHSSPEAPPTTQARETSASEGRNYYQGIQLANPEFTKVLGSFTCRKAETWDRFFHFPSQGRHAEDYSNTRKIQRLRPGSNPRTRVPEASMLTTRPPKQS